MVTAPGELVCCRDETLLGFEPGDAEVHAVTAVRTSDQSLLCVGSVCYELAASLRTRPLPTIRSIHYLSLVRGARLPG